MSEPRPHLKIGEIRTPEDRTYPGSGGGGTYPRSSYARHAAKVFTEVQALKSNFENATDAASTTKRYVRVEVPDSTNLWKTDARKIENSILGTLVGTPSQNIGHFSTRSDSFESLIEQLNTYQISDANTGKSKFAVIESIGKIPAEEKVSEGLYKLIESGGYSGEALVTLFPDLTREEQETMRAVINQYLSDKEGQILSDVDTEFGKVFRVKAKAETIEDLAEAFLSIQTVDPMEEVLTESAVAGAQIESTITVLPNDSNAKVCIFDSGVVRGSRFIDSNMLGYEEPIGAPHDVDHGTFVASRIIYGNSLRDDVSRGTLKPDTKVLSVCMISHDDIGNRKPAQGDVFLRIIRDTVRRWHQSIKVYNLSMSMVYQNSTAAIVTDDHVGAIAAEIDKLSKQYKVLFVVTTGNVPINSLTPPPTEPYPNYFLSDNSRLCRPGEAMLAVTVGSVADREDGGSMAKINTPSPFTRRGPGFNGYRKPDLVAQGGNYAANWRQYNDLSVVAIGRDGDRLAYGNGTSYAAPLISRLAAQIFEHVPTATPDLVRALLIHSAADAQKNSIDDETFRHLIGNGVPSAEKILTSDKWNQNYVFQGVIGFRKIMKIPFYVPRGLISRSGRKKVRIRLTIVFSPETNRTLKAGYCKSHLRMQLSKLNENGVLTAAGVDENSSEVIKDRYSTVIRYDKTFSDGLKEGEWELLIEQESKWTLTDTNTPYAVIITVSDPRKDNAVDIYQLINTEVPNRYENLLSVQQQLRI